MNELGSASSLGFLPFLKRKKKETPKWVLVALGVVIGLLIARRKR